MLNAAYNLTLQELIIPYNTTDQELRELLGGEDQVNLAKEIIEPLQQDLESLLGKYAELENKVDECTMMGVLNCKLHLTF